MTGVQTCALPIYQVEFSDGAAALAENPGATTDTFTIDATWERVTVTDSLTNLDAPERLTRLRVTRTP